eukprot:CAMPEP_0194029198 /NCGR_PEP_ID=MMETSP0009_2-20130614/3005_1 /TAXON_ID=210454 /ORGANISM="Grammatophora oceanica, Strain CCMP 410" /LENGTH=127 /DNA_ID=CAMNT_0038668805 /DNA_START=126 /DNA_END=509 /DNA_ORIENTATION=-
MEDTSSSSRDDERRQVPPTVLERLDSAKSWCSEQRGSTRLLQPIGGPKAAETSVEEPPKVPLVEDERVSFREALGLSPSKKSFESVASSTSARRLLLQRLNDISDKEEGETLILSSSNKPSSGREGL